MINPVFILGCPRSGTTLLARLLGATIYGEPVESHFITKYHKRLDGYGPLDSFENFNRLLQDILSERPIMQWRIEIDPQIFFDSLERVTYPEIVHQLYMVRSNRLGYRSWGDKTPSYILEVDIIVDLFPDARYIYIVRDGRDVALSLLERPWGPNNFFSCATYWKEYNRTNETLEKLKQNGQLFFLKYEDLLVSAEKILPKLYQFLDQPYEQDEMAALAAQIRKGNFNKWKSRMKNHQIKLFERISSDTLKRFGYETSYSAKDLGKLTEAFFTLHNKLGRALFLLKINTIDMIKIKYFGKEPFAE